MLGLIEWLIGFASTFALSHQADTVLQRPLQETRVETTNVEELSGFSQALASPAGRELLKRQDVLRRLSLINYADFSWIPSPPPPFGYIGEPNPRYLLGMTRKDYHPLPPEVLTNMRRVLGNPIVLDPAFRFPEVPARCWWWHSVDEHGQWTGIWLAVSWSNGAVYYIETPTMAAKAGPQSLAAAAWSRLRDTFQARKPVKTAPAPPGATAEERQQARDVLPVMKGHSSDIALKPGTPSRPLSAGVVWGAVPAVVLERARAHFGPPEPVALAVEGVPANSWWWESLDGNGRPWGIWFALSAEDGTCYHASEANPVYPGDGPSHSQLGRLFMEAVFGGVE